MRTLDEIVQRCKSSDSFLSFGLEVLLPYLPFSYAKELLREDADEQKWANEIYRELTEESVREQMKDYMEFAWEKVGFHKGISASRSVEKMTEWMWLLGDDEGVAFANNDDNYQPYGAPILGYICKRYDFPIPEDSFIERMVQGKPCIDDCQNGCI